MVPEPSKERNLVPKQCWNVVTCATEVQKILLGGRPPPACWEDVEGLLLAQEQSKAAMVLNKLLNLRLSDVMSDAARRALEVCVAAHIILQVLLHCLDLSQLVVGVVLDMLDIAVEHST